MFAMYTLWYTKFVVHVAPLSPTICVVPALATVESNFIAYKGCQLETNETIIHIHIRHTRLLAEFYRGVEYMVLCCQSLYSMV